MTAPDAHSPDSWLVVQEGLRAVSAALREQPAVDDVADRRLEELLDAATRTGTLDVFGARDAGRLGPGTCALLLAGLVDRWSDGGSSRDAVELAVLAPVLVDPASVDGAHLLVAAEAVEALGDVAEAQTCHASADAARALLALARSIAYQPSPRGAFGCAIAALNLLTEDDSAALGAAEFALRLAQSLHEPDLVLRLRMRHATSIAAVADADESLRLAAFDSAEAAVRYLIGEPSQASELAGLIVDLSAHPWLRDPLAPVLALAVASLDERTDADARGIARAAPISEGLTDDVFEGREIVSRWFDVEPARYTLKTAPRGQAEALWSTWAMDHPRFDRAIPSGGSVLHEEDLEELLLTVGHEMTHVLTMFSGIGRCVYALRAALFEAEMDLLWFTRPGAVDWTAPVPTAPDRHHPRLLARAEQALELGHKLSIVQDVWEPWLEGVAVFGELGAEPLAEDELLLPHVRIVTNLRDVHAVGEAREGGEARSRAWRAAYDEEEQRYRDALAHLSPDFLGAYVDRYAAKYLAGYIAVRGVVSAWRRTLDAPLSGADAFQVLLHVTRFGSDEAVPDLGLDLREFRRAAHRGMVDWVRRLAAIPADELRWAYSVGTEGERGSWSAGRLVLDTGDIEESRARSGLRLVRRFEEALETLGSERARPDRVHGASAECRLAMDAASAAIRLEADDRSIDASMLAWLNGRTGLVPIARAACPFWMTTRRTRRLQVVLRNVERHRDHGGPSHALTTIILPEDEAQLLEAEARRLGRARLDVVRLVDVAAPREGDVHGPGRHVLAYALGEFVVVQPAGLLASDPSDELIELVRGRLRHNPVLDMETEVLAHGTAGALRTRDWIDCAEAWSDDSRSYDVEPWAMHVRALAQTFLDGPSDSAHAAKRSLLELVVGERADGVAAHGLQPLREEVGWMDAAVAALDRTARAPQPDEWLDKHATAVSELVAPLFERTAHGWDVRPIGESIAS